MEAIEYAHSKVYALVDAQGRVTRIEGGYTMGNIDDLARWTYLGEGDGDKYNLCQAHYLPDGLFTGDGLYRWKYENGECVLRTEAELEADRAAIPAPEPTQLDRVEAQTVYTAMMTDTLLEE